MSSEVDADPEIVRPGTLAEARQVVLDEPDAALLFRGGGTRACWGRPPRRADRVVDTRDLAGVVAHRQEDLTVTVRAGTPVAALEAELAAAGQLLGADAPVGSYAAATVGGLVASSDSGPRRLRYGPLRDQVIGATVVLPDGTVARSGGTVIKNVAGYDVAKLMCGSLGTLGLVAEITLRLRPRPEASAAVRAAADPAAAERATLALLAAPLEPALVDWVDGTMVVAFDGPARTVAEQTADAATLLADAGCTSVDRDAPAESQPLAAAHRGEDERDLVVRGATLPDGLAAAVRSAHGHAERLGLVARVASHTALGLHTARIRVEATDEAVQAGAAFVDAWRGDLTGMGGHAVVRERPPTLEGVIDVFGPAPAAAPLMNAVKRQLDPQDRCAPGRMEWEAT